MKLVRFLIGSLLVAGMLAVAPAAFADEDGGERGPREVSNKDQGGDSGEGGSECWNPICARGVWNPETQATACDELPYIGECYCNAMTTPEGGACAAT